MKMRMRRLLSALALAASTAWGATEVTDDGYTWTYERGNDGGVRIMGVEPDLEGEVAFPASLGGRTVVDVETSALQTENVTALTVPASLADSASALRATLRSSSFAEWSRREIKPTAALNARLESAALQKAANSSSSSSSPECTP